MAQLLDPRPLTPPETGLRDEIQWTITHWQWNRQKGCYTSTGGSFSGKPEAFLKEVVTLLQGSGQREIHFDASCLENRGGTHPSDYEIKVPDFYQTLSDWQVSPVLGGEEIGTDVDELFGWIQWGLDNQKALKIEFGEHDPTP